MKTARRFLLPVSAMAVLAIAFALVNPKAVHAVAAAFVQVANTPANAVPMMAAPAQSQLYHSACSASYAGQYQSYCTLTPVPAGQTLFIETVSVFSESDVGRDPILVRVGPHLQPDNTNALLYVPLFQQKSLQNFDNFVGIVSARVAVSAADLPQCGAMLSGTSNNGFLTCEVSGYLAPAQ